MINAGVSAKYNITYRYTFDTTLVAMSSYRSNVPVTDERGIMRANDEETLRTIFDLDAANRNYFKPHPAIL